MADKNFTLTKEKLHELFTYNNGHLYWKKRNQNKAGCLNNEGYINIVINQKWHKAHRLIFLMHYGYMPEFIDHIDNNRSNNKIENLRQATREQNQRNRECNKNSTTKIKGVSFHKCSKKWIAQCRANGKNNYLGVYKTAEEAQKVVENFRFFNHGNFAKS